MYDRFTFLKILAVFLHLVRPNSRSFEFFALPLSEFEANIAALKKQPVSDRVLPRIITFSFPLYIGAISYEVTWLITVIGYTISVPDTVMGLSFLAVGTSIPEVFSSLIVSKQVTDRKMFFS